jgi:hypothetical protein
MPKWGFEIGKWIQELVGELHVIYRILEYINTMVEPFWKNESEVYYEELSSFKPEEKGTYKNNKLINRKQNKETTWEIRALLGEQY